MLKRKIAALLVASSMLSMGASSAFAGSATGTVGASATVTSACSLSTNAMAFGSVSGLLTTNATASTTMSVSCSNSTAYTVALSAGTTTGATTTARMLANGSITLNYGIYQDAAFAHNFGSTTGASGDVETATGNGSAQTINVYAMIPAGQVVAPGSYTDTITATVSY